MFELTQSIVIIILVLELLLLGFLLLPLPTSISFKVTQLLKGTHKYVVSLLLIFILYLVLESYMRLGRYNDQEMVPDAGSSFMARQDYFRKKFHSERDFYLNIFTLAALVAIFRVRQMISLMCKTQNELDELTSKVK